MVYYCYILSLHVCSANIFFILDSSLAILWQSNYPFGFPLVTFFSLWLSFFMFVFLFLWSLGWEV